MYHSSVLQLNNHDLGELNSFKIRLIPNPTLEEPFIHNTAFNYAQLIANNLSLITKN